MFKDGVSRRHICEWLELDLEYVDNALRRALKEQK